jgi:predicted phosphoadenosine phosphosulfate sulfurtransferase
VARRVLTGGNVFEQALARLTAIYDEGHRIVVSFSGGKDSGVCLELAIMAARATGRLPVEVVMRDEEIMFPGTFEYVERVAERPDVEMHWLVANQPIVNIYNRREPYFWTFDPLVDRADWVRQPPASAVFIKELSIDRMTIPERFPPPAGKHLMAVIGLRVVESRGRRYGLFSSKGYITQPNRYGVRAVRPIYDWTDGDIWKAINDNGWDYNRAYDVMHKMGVARHRLRIAPPTLNLAGADSLQVAARAWPQWFDRVCHRLEGVRLVARYGRRAVEPLRRVGESWQDCFNRECVNEAPAAWIRERAVAYSTAILHAHARHSTTPLPDVNPCIPCQGNLGSWRTLTMALYNGDPFSLKCTKLPYMEPEFFRPGSGTWRGKPTF